jgi:alkanal monooxygenase alpha chain
MKFGIFLTTAQPPSLSEQEVLRRSLEYTQLAETLHFDGAWVLEHHFTSFGICSSPITMCAFLLGQTRRIRVGTAISIVALDHPLRLAEQVGLLDQLSGGRFDFGVGRGMFTKDFDVFGVDMAANHRIVEEWVELIVRAQTQDKVGSDGPYVRFPEVRITPKPLQRPHTPIYVICSSPQTVEWAASRGFPMVLHHRIEDARKVEQLAQYRRAAEKAGRDPDAVDHVLACLSYVADSQAEAEAAIRPHLEWYVQQGILANGLLQNRNRLQNYGAFFQDVDQKVKRGEASPAKIVDLMMQVNPVGTPERCVERLQELRELTGIRHYIVGFEGPDSFEATTTSMRRFGAEVVSKLR